MLLASVGLPEGQTFIQYFFGQFSWLQLGDFVLRLVIACVCGAVIGLERSRRFKGAGIRTHIIVCCGAALMMIVSKYGFADLINIAGEAFGGVRTADPARIAAQVVSGISFLGAGVIFKNKGAVKGLTTAAGLWVTAGIGLAIGGGMFIIGIIATVIVAVLQVIMHKFKIGEDSFNAYQIQFEVQDSEEFRTLFEAQMKKWEATATDSRLDHRDNGMVAFDMTIRTTQVLSMADLMKFFDGEVKAKSVSLSNLH